MGAGWGFYILIMCEYDLRAVYNRRETINKWRHAHTQLLMLLQRSVYWCFCQIEQQRFGSTSGDKETATWHFYLSFYPDRGILLKTCCTERPFISTSPHLNLCFCFGSVPASFFFFYHNSPVSPARVKSPVWHHSSSKLIQICVFFFVFVTLSATSSV